MKRVSTHSHPKVAAAETLQALNTMIVSTHSHPKVAASVEGRVSLTTKSAVSTHSHPKVAAQRDSLRHW